MTIPEVIVKNARTIRFTADIVDENGALLSGVTASARRHARQVDLLFGKSDEIKECAPQLVDGKFFYRGFGDYGVVVTYSKQGYKSQSVGYATDDHTVFEGPLLFIVWTILHTDQYVNVRKEPQSLVILLRDPPAATIPGEKKPEAIGPPVP